MNGKEFLEIHQNNMEILGFWDEDWKATILRVIESRYQKEIIREWGISDMVMNGEKVLLKWYKRYTPLSDEEMKKMFGEDKN